MTSVIFYLVYFFSCALFSPLIANTAIVQNEDEVRNSVEKTQKAAHERIINRIIIRGNSQVPTQTILNAIPYREGEIFNPSKSGTAIRNVYSLGDYSTALGWVNSYFKPGSIKLVGRFINADKIDVIIEVEEKKRKEAVVFHGNKHLPPAEIKKKIDFDKISMVDEDDLPKYVTILKKLYRDKDYHNVQINVRLEGDDQKTTIIFTIDEGNKTVVQRVLFTGNNYFTGKKLRSLLFTRENWVMGFLDRSGSFQPDAIEHDKQVIENYYQSNGFLNARVYDVSIDTNDTKEHLFITFHIQEGDQYTVSEVHVPGNTIVSQEALQDRLPIKPGDLYSKDKVRETIEFLRLLWGEHGHIYADIEPSLQPDDEHKTVKLGFYTELGPQVILNRITIVGNRKTHDKVIRRQLTLREGGIVTTRAMDESKNRVESLGYFDARTGVNWKIQRIDREHANLDLIVKEIKTGRFEAQIGFGGSPRDISSPMESFSIKAGVTDTNLFGRGLRFSLMGELSKEERSLIFNLTEPWLFDKPIHAGIDIFVKRTTYDEFNYLQDKNIHEHITGGLGNLGFVVRKFFDSLVTAQLGVENVFYRDKPKVDPAARLTEAEKIELQRILDNRFAEGTFVWLGGSISKDVRNHPMHPSRGYQWSSIAKFAFPSSSHKFGFFKIDLDGSWYTPVIGERTLVFGIHGHAGFIVPFKGMTVPFRELYNIGGPASVRGYEFGQISPFWVNSTPPVTKTNLLGGTKAFWINAELVFPIASDFSIKGAFFYDGGAGWDTPDSNKIDPIRLRNNFFDFRQSVGFGIRLLQPTPMKIDWGFKLDPRKGESASEVHFSAYHEF